MHAAKQLFYKSSEKVCFNTDLISFYI